jgi:hypothetical protein
MKSWKPGSQPEQAAEVGSRGDFGVPEGIGPSADRDYVSENTKRSDPGASRPASHEHDGVRTSGAGADYSGPGSASGGDIDTDIVGVGTGGSGLAQSGPDDRTGPDDSDGTSNEFASPVPKGQAGQANVIPAQGRNQGGVGKVGGSKRVRGSTTRSSPDISTGQAAQGADAATNPEAQNEDSFMSEVSSGEASGQDLPIAPSQDTQGAVEGDNQIEGLQKDVRGDSADPTASKGS